MFFKITQIGDENYIKMGMINVDAALYLEKGDEGYEKYIAEHLVNVPVIPEGGYQGDVDEMSMPIDPENYDAWIKSLPTVQQLNPFCTHSIQFEHDVTEEEILWCFEWALAMTRENYLLDDLHCKKGGRVVNQDIKYLSRKAFYEGVKIIPVASQSAYIKNELAKIESTRAKVETLKDIDFKNVETIATYSVK